VRILMVADFYPPFLGGLERQTQLLSKELAGRGHRVHVATVWHQGLAAQEDDGGVCVHRLRGLTTVVPWFSTVPGRRYHPPFPDPAIAWQLRRLIKSVEPDVVHAHGWISYSCAVALLGRKTPLLISSHDYGYSCAVRILLHRGEICTGPAPLKCLACATRSQGILKGAAAVTGVFGSRALLRRKANAAHGVSSFVQQFMQRHLLNARQVSVVIPDIGTSGIVDSGNLSQPTTGINPGLPSVPYILYVGGLTAAKGLLVLLAAYRRLPAPRPPLVLVGTVWPDTPKEFPPGVTVLRNLPNEQVMSAWRGSLFGVQPSLCAETFGMAIVEAMTQGKAMIASRVGGIGDVIVDGKTGILVSAGDAEGLAGTMQRLIENPPLRESLGEAGRARADLFAASSVVPRFEALYERLAHGGKSIPQSPPELAEAMPGPRQKMDAGA
jgi:glycosyltransferase involved in cell wall biosynthesis